MDKMNKFTGGKAFPGIYKIVKEKLKGANVELTDFVFRPGGNVYVFSYEKKGTRRHTFIDSGDKRYYDSLLPILRDNGINESNIDRIFITHRHFDHSGLIDLLAEKSEAKVMVHPGFRSFVEGNISKEEKWWMGDFDPTKFNKYNLEYMSTDNGNGVKVIGGVEFPKLCEALEIGDDCRLEILGCPESTKRHSPDQIIILYSPSGQLTQGHNADNRFRPTDDIIFCGDLWLMRGPIYDTPPLKRLPRTLRFKYHQLRSRLKGNPIRRVNIREQDAEAKEALKKGFSLVRVKPGHGDEFVGARIIPQSLLAKRDIIMKLGYPIDKSTAVLKDEDNVSKVDGLRKEAYYGFIDELLSWKKWGYSSEEIAGLLRRIYLEQNGGSGSVKKDRKERRKWLKETLIRMKFDNKISEELNSVAESALIGINDIR